MYTSGSIQRSPRTMCAWERVRNFIIVKRIRIKDDSTEIPYGWNAWQRESLVNHSVVCQT